MALLIASRRNEIRDSTGHLLSESTDPRYNPADPNGAGYFVAGEPVVNWATRAAEQARENWRETHGGKDADLSGYFWPVYLRERTPPKP